MIPAAKEKIASVIEATEESIQGIGEGFKHGATLATGMGVGAAQNVTTSTEESIQKASKETPRAMQDIQQRTESAGESIDQSVEDTKRKGIATKIAEKLEGAKQEAKTVNEGLGPDVHGLRKKSSENALGH